LNASAITKEDYARNPQAVIEVLEFYSKETARAGEMESYAVHSPPCIFMLILDKWCGERSRSKSISDSGSWKFSCSSKNN
jgi:hypothetical protein